MPLLSANFLGLEQEKEEAERKVGELSSAVESLSEELVSEKNISRAARESAKRATKELAVVSRAVQSLGCKVNFTRNGDCTVEVEDGPQKCSHPVAQKQSENNTTDVSEPITSVTEQNVCEALCPLRTREGSCRWPDAGCAQIRSQFAGFTANYEAFDKLSIYDSYFTAE